MSDFSIARQNMVDNQVHPSDVTDLRILDAMLAIPRELFVPADRRPLAYLDLDIDLTGMSTQRRYLIKPAVLAKMIQAAAIKETDRVLIVGAATGYSAAVIAQLAKQVIALESDPALAAQAKRTFGQLGIANVPVEIGTLADGCRTQAPYDVIFLDGGTEIIPEQLYEQLAQNGRLVGVFALNQPSRATLVISSPGDFGNRIFLTPPRLFCPDLNVPRLLPSRNRV